MRTRSCAQPRIRLRTLFVLVLAVAAGLAGYRQLPRGDRRSYELVYVGMSQDEVVRRLGPPAESHHCQLNFKSIRCDQIWQYHVNELDGPRNLQILFSGGRIAHGYSSGDSADPSCLAMPILPGPNHEAYSWPGNSGR